MERPNLTEAAKNWINGSWNTGGTIRHAVSPSTGQLLGSYLDAGSDEARYAIEAARTAFDTTNWSKERSLRSRALFELADEVAKRVDEIAIQLAREGGKLLAQTQWELVLTVEWLRYGAATALLQTGGRALGSRSGDALSFRSRTSWRCGSDLAMELTHHPVRARLAPARWLPDARWY